MDVIRNVLARYEHTREEEMSLEEYLEQCRRDPLVYATAAERMLAALNAAPGRAEALKRIGAVARYLAESGQATEDGVRALAAVVADLVQEVAK
jgi:predicted Ser/Thr protein kinase